MEIDFWQPNKLLNKLLNEDSEIFKHVKYIDRISLSRLLNRLKELEKNLKGTYEGT